MEGMKGQKKGHISHTATRGCQVRTCGAFDPDDSQARDSSGAFFNYEISPMLVVHTENRKSFAHFLTSCVYPLLSTSSMDADGLDR
jgi:hypothetical protein